MGLFTDAIKKSKFSRKIFFGFAAVLAATVAGCGGVVGPLNSVTPPPTVQSLTAADVSTLVQAAAQAAEPNTMVIAVVDRAGNVPGRLSPEAVRAGAGDGKFQRASGRPTRTLLFRSRATGAFFSKRSGAAFLTHRTLHQRNSFPARNCEHAQRATLRNRKHEPRAARFPANFIAGQSVPPAALDRRRDNRPRHHDGQSGRE